MLFPAEEFNDKILKPELSDSELQRLHGEVLHIYHTYCLDESIDKINFDSAIVEQIRNGEKRGRTFPALLPEPNHLSSQSLQVRTLVW